MYRSISVARLAAFTISLLLLTEAIEPGWGVGASWGWYLALVLLTFMSLFDLLSFVTFVLAWLLLLGLVDGSRAAFIATTIFSGSSLLRQLLTRGGRRPWTWYSYRFGPPRAGWR